VLRERLGRHAIARSRAARPDLIILGAELSDIAGVEVCRTLRGDQPVGGPPIVIVMGQPAGRELRLAALRAGAWECLAPPHDAEEILLKLHTFIEAKREADRARSEGLLDPATGLYNRLGLAGRARELGALALRDHSALACVVLAVDPEAGRFGPIDDAEQLLRRCAAALRHATRRSDIVGRLAPAEFAVLAPGGDAPGARRLAERLVRVAQSTAPDGHVRCGYDAVANVGDTPLDPVQLLVRAAAAVRVGREEPGASEVGIGRWIRRFNDGDDERP
jgi:PleD family two-component response regulator